MRTKKTYTDISEYQQELKDLCIKNANEFCGENYEVTTEHDKVYEWNGDFTFMLSIQAKNRNSLLIITDKTWMVQITRRGKITSKKIIGYKIRKNAGMRINKYATFI